MRKYLPTFSELIDRLTIVTLKSIRLGEHKEEYEREAKDIMSDLTEIAAEKNVVLTGEVIRAIALVMLSNSVIWDNESKARLGGSEQDKLLKFTHSVNGVRNRAKNVISRCVGERKDLKVDCLAAEVCKAQGYDFEDVG